ncbi:MAG: hypothetical protein QNJ74_03000 [Trichodesmium sp. MO_231.B1]|nr:hypothetical protein [Trichodesmium sp. MO_231.B1]
MATTITERNAQQGEYTWEQMILCQMTLVYCVSFPTPYSGSQEYLTKLATESVKTTFASQKVQQLIGKWELVWGVNIYQSKHSVVADNTMYVAKYAESLDIDKYVISIIGTNPFSTYAVLCEDARFFYVQKWNEGKPWNSKKSAAYTDEPAVPSGLSLALEIQMVRMKDSEGNVLVDILREIVSKATKPVEITVAGHSLAGAIAPMLGLSLLDCQSEWDSKNIVTIKVASLAGITPGNEAFAKYYQKKLGDRTQRILCDKDIIPYLATIDGFDITPNLYAPEISNNVLISRTFKIIEKGTEQQKFTPISNTPAYPGNVDSSILSEDINQNEILKQIVATECSKLIYLVWLEQLEMIPFMPNFVEDKFQELEEELSQRLGKVITKILGGASNVDEELENIFTHLVNSVSTVPIVGVLSQFDRNLLSTTSIFGLINYFIQMTYQHTKQYVDHFGISDFASLEVQITAQIYEKLRKQNVSQQKANTVVIEYGKAKKEDIKDLFNGEGKLLNNISDVVAQLKLSGSVEENVQPLLFIIEKEKDKGICRWLI